MSPLTMSHEMDLLGFLGLIMSYGNASQSEILKYVVCHVIYSHHMLGDGSILPAQSYLASQQILGILALPSNISIAYTMLLW